MPSSEGGAILCRGSSGNSNEQDDGPSSFNHGVGNVLNKPGATIGAASSRSRTNSGVKPRLARGSRQEATSQVHPRRYGRLCAQAGPLSTPPSPAHGFKAAAWNTTIPRLRLRSGRQAAEQIRDGQSHLLPTAASSSRLDSHRPQTAALSGAERQLRAAHR